MDNNRFDEPAKPEMRPQPLRWKVFAFLLSFCALLLVILWLFQTVFLNDMYKWIRTRELKQAISQIEKEINNPDILEIIGVLQVEKDIIIMPTREFIIPQRPGQITVTRSNIPMDTLTEVREFALENGQEVSLTFYAVIMPVNATVITLREQLYIISGIMLLSAVIFAVIIAKRVAKPIEDISKSAVLLAKGDYNTYFKGHGYREIATLSDTLNTAAFELGRVETLRRELMANVSHDLRTPLALIYSYAEMMNDFPEEITNEHTQVIMDETKRLTSLVNDILALSKLESDMEKLEITSFNLTETIREFIGRMSELLRTDGFNIKFLYSGEIFVNADKTKIDRVFYNLLINAVNYSGNNKNITVEQVIENDVVRINVVDNGEGIAESELPYIWDRYYKSGNNHKRAVTGTGLGLSIIKKIMDLHGFEKGYGVVSEVGRGSTFWFEIGIKN